MINETLNIKKTSRLNYPYANSKEEFNNVSLEYDEEGIPVTVTKTDFVIISQIPNTNDL